MKNIRIATIVTAMLIALSLLPLSPASAATRRQVAYVYHDDAAARAAFQRLIMSYGFDFTAVPLSEVSTYDFSRASIIVVAPDTADGYSSFRSPEAAVILEATRKPIVGVGRGGAMLFDSINPALSYGNSANGDTDSVAVARMDGIWTNPYRVATLPLPPKTASSATRVKLFNQPSPFTALWHGAMQPTTIAFANLIDTDQYHPLAASLTGVGQKTLLWGFHSDPRAMTSGGQRLFINALNRVTTL